MITVQELIDWLRDGENLGYSHGLGRRDVGIIPTDFTGVRIEGKYNLTYVVGKINERIADGANQPKRSQEEDGSSSRGGDRQD